jgi:dinuclear metal center YbgI/SA1388 family protein
MTRIETLTRFLDSELRIDEFTDSSNNGLQVDHPSGKIEKICLGVDASSDLFERAQKRKADLVIVHHGLSWGDSLKRITGLNYKKIASLVKLDMALYASHLPLDAHPRYGNNARICRTLGLKKLKRFGEYKGTEIGYMGEFAEPVSYANFKKMVKDRIGANMQTTDFGPKRISTVGVISGDAGDEVEQAAKQNLDVYLSGESSLVAYNLAKEYNMNAVFAGHYATEVFGVRALSKMLAKKFNVETEMIDFGIPF